MNRKGVKTNVIYFKLVTRYSVCSKDVIRTSLGVRCRCVGGMNSVDGKVDESSEGLCLDSTHTCLPQHRTAIYVCTLHIHSAD